jgi:hypothetical protein
MVSLYEQMAMVGHYLATMKLPLIVLARLRKYALEFHLYRSFKHLMSVLRNGTKRYAKITGNTPTSWWQKEVKPLAKQDEDSIF